MFNQSNGIFQRQCINHFIIIKIKHSLVNLGLKYIYLSKYFFKIIFLFSGKKAIIILFPKTFQHEYQFIDKANELNSSCTLRMQIDAQTQGINIFREKLSTVLQYKSNHHCNTPRQCSLYLVQWAYRCRYVMGSDPEKRDSVPQDIYLYLSFVETCDIFILKTQFCVITGPFILVYTSEYTRF